MAVAVSEDHQCRVVKWTEARSAKCFLADELDTDMSDGHGHTLRRKLQLYIPKPNPPKEAKRSRQTNSLHTHDKCDPLGLGLMWDTCFLRLVEPGGRGPEGEASFPGPKHVPLTRDLLQEALSGLCHSTAVHHDLFQDAAVLCDVPQTHAGAADASDEEQLTIKSIVEEVDIDDDDDDDDECVTGDEGSDQDQDDEEEEEFEEEEL